MVQMSVRNVRIRILALAGAVLALSACFTDRSADGVPSGEVCEAAAILSDEMTATGGDPGPAVRGALATLGGALERSGLDPGAADAAYAMAAIDVPGPAWLDGFTVLDAWSARRCGFALSMIIVAGAPAAAVPRGPVADDGVYGWDDVVAAVRDTSADSSWTDAGYPGAVGTGPGVYVTVSGVPDVETAGAVCRDVLGAIEAAPVEGDRFVEVLSAGTTVLAISGGGECVTAQAMR